MERHPEKDTKWTNKVMSLPRDSISQDMGIKGIPKHNPIVFSNLGFTTSQLRQLATEEPDNVELAHFMWTMLSLPLTIVGGFLYVKLRRLKQTFSQNISGDPEQPPKEEKLAAPAGPSFE